MLDAGLESVAVWVVRRTRIRVNRWPRFAERFELTTFCSGLGRMWAERRTDVVRSGAEAPDVEAVSLWVHLRSGAAPAVPADRDRGERLFGTRAPAAGDRAAAPSAAACVVRSGSEWTFRATESDIADHVNNAAYWQPLEEELLQRDAEPGPVDIELEYRAPAQPGVKRWLAEGEARWIVGGGQAGGEAELHASFLLRS